MPPSSGVGSPVRGPSDDSRRSKMSLSSATAPNQLLRYKACNLYLHVYELGGSEEMTLEELRAQADAGTVDTVLLALTDMQGRLQGKRLTARHFLAEVAEHGAEGCNYLLGVDVDMTTVAGYAMFSWERGYGDFVLRPDLDTLRPVPWQEGTVVCLADVAWLDGSDVVASPRQILRRPLARLAGGGLARNRGHGGRVHGLQRHLRGSLAQELPRPAPGEPLQRRLLAVGHRAGG